MVPLGQLSCPSPWRSRKQDRLHSHVWRTLCRCHVRTVDALRWRSRTLLKNTLDDTVINFVEAHQVDKRLLWVRNILDVLHEHREAVRIRLDGMCEWGRQTDNELDLLKWDEAIGIHWDNIPQRHVESFQKGRDVVSQVLRFTVHWTDGESRGLVWSIVTLGKHQTVHHTHDDVHNRKWVLKWPQFSHLILGAREPSKSRNLTSSSSSSSSSSSNDCCTRVTVDSGIDTSYYESEKWVKNEWRVREYHRRGREGVNQSLIAHHLRRDHGVRGCHDGVTRVYLYHSPRRWDFRLTFRVCGWYLLPLCYLTFNKQTAV